MSETSQGPGWWLASDNKWYPPAAPPAAPTPPPLLNQPPPYGAAPLNQPPPYAPSPYATQPVKKSGKGCLIAALVVFGVLALFAIGAAVLVSMFADDVVEGALGGGDCLFLSDDDAADALGAGATTMETSGLSGVLVMIDARVMPDDEDCSLQGAGESAGLGRVARYEGPNAARKYQDELTKAKGITESRGNGLSVTTDEYFNKELRGVGDEAFCTKSSGLGAGALVRKGDTLVYASVVANSSAAPGVDLSNPDNAKLGTDDLHCQIAQRIAAAVLR